MAGLISVYDSHSHVPALLIDEPEPGFLMERYFPTDAQMDTFDTTDVILDFQDGDFESAAYVQKGYIDAELPGFATNEVTPPRLALKSKIDPKGRHRLVFERLCRQVGELSPSKADAYEALTRMRARQLSNRIRRSIEKQIVDVLVNNSVLGQIPETPGSETMVDVEIRYYQKTKTAKGVMVGNEQRLKPKTAWGAPGATPYRDVQKMVRVLHTHGGRPDELLIAPEAWILLQNDEEFKANFTACPRQHDGELGPSRAVDAGERGAAEYVGWLAFMGHRVEIIVYNGQYLADDGTWVPFLPVDFVCVLSKNVGHVLCGATTFVNPEALRMGDYDGGYITVPGLYAFSKFVDVNNNTVEIRVESNPIAAPRAHWGWVTMLAENKNAISEATEGPFADLQLVSDTETATYGGAKLPMMLAESAKMGSTIELDPEKIAPGAGGLKFDHAELDGQALDLSGKKVTVPAESSAIDLIFVPSA